MDLLAELPGADNVAEPARLAAEPVAAAGIRNEGNLLLSSMLTDLRLVHCCLDSQVDFHSDLPLLIEQFDQMRLAVAVDLSSFDRPPFFFMIKPRELSNKLK